MPVTGVILVAALAVVVILGIWREPGPHGGWIWFCLWALPGFLAALSVLSFAIGLLVLPVALISIVAAARFASGAETLGFLPGIGAMCVLVGVPGVADDTATRSWFLAGAVFAVAGAVPYAWRHARTARAGSHSTA